ncbi:MAG: hypothetical protein NT027_08820 [Proteobacteria bacterium]|nr:hypothetical protein [Pseudomonadota bacterium]
MEGNSHDKTSMGQLQPSSTWTNGWYLFEDGKVIGPLNANETFSRGGKSVSGKPILVSRKGFSQWYPLTDFAELHLLANKYAEQLAGSISVDNFSSKQPVADKVNTRLEKPTSFADNLHFAESELPISNPEVKIAPNAFDQYIANEKNQKNLSRKEKKRVGKQSQKAPILRETHSAEQNVSTLPKSFQDRYLVLSSRLRLGKFRSGFVAGFITLPLSLLYYWPAWLRLANEEMNWHLNGSAKVQFKMPLVFCLVPILHLLFAYESIILVQKLERQNGYKTVSLLGGMLLAVFPPLLIWRLQNAMNLHWKLHVKNAKAV